jgi:L-threonylcarbamoyladenylate synthase
VLLRPGVLTTVQIEAVAGEPLRTPDAQAPRASGTLASHYAPRATVRLLGTAELHEELVRFESAWQARPQSPDNSVDQKRAERTLAVYSRTAMAAPAHGLVHRAMPDDAVVAAHELFAVLRAFDDEGVQHIWVEAPPSDPSWDGVRDRLSRAAA